MCSESETSRQLHQCHNPLKESIPALYLVPDFSPSDPRKLEVNDTFFFFLKKSTLQKTPEMKLDMTGQLKITRI